MAAVILFIVTAIVAIIALVCHFKKEGSEGLHLHHVSDYRRDIPALIAAGVIDGDSLRIVTLRCYDYLNLLELNEDTD